MHKNEIIRRQEKCLEFIHRKNTDRPLLGVMWEPTILPITAYVNRIDVTKPAQASDISADEMCNICDKIMVLCNEIEQDYFLAAQASFNHHWLNAALGCKIKVAPDTIWAEPSGASLSDIAAMEDDIESPWLDKMLACHKKLISHAAGRYPVAVPWIDGPLDLLSSLIGPEKLGLALYDHPDLVLEAMDKMTKFWSRQAAKLIQGIEPFADGYVSRMHTWTEKPSVTLQDDATWMMSPESYNKFVYPFEKRMIEAVPASVYHTHNTSTQILEFLGKSDMTAVQVTIDTNASSPWDIQRREIAKLQEIKPVILSCFNIPDAERARRDLSPRGLALTIVLYTVDGMPEPKMLKEYKQWYKERCI